MANGAKIILKQTENKNNEVIMYAMAKGGTLNAPLEYDISARLLSEMAQVSGLGPYSLSELINRLAGKEASTSYFMDAYLRGMQSSSTTRDLQTLFEMIYLFFTSPRLDENAVAAMLDQYKTYLTHNLEDPQRVFSNEVNSVLSRNYPRFKPLELSDIDKVSIEQAEEFLLLCVNPADYTFAFTGNMVYLYWEAPEEEEFDDGKIQTAAVLSEYLSILLNDEIREKLGGVYGISSGASAPVIPRGEYSLSVYFVCNPERAEELSAAVIDCLNGIINKPIDADIFNKAKEALIMSREKSMQSNLHIAQSYINSSVSRKALFIMP